MAEKNTLSILETIKKKMHKLDQKSEKTVAPASSNEEFQYISSAPKAEVAAALEVKVPEQKIDSTMPKFEDDLGLEDLGTEIAPPIPNTPPVAPVENKQPEALDDFNLDDLDLDSEAKTPAEAAPAAEVKQNEVADFNEDDIEDFEDEVDIAEDEVAAEEVAEEHQDEAVADVDWLGNKVVADEVEEETPAVVTPKVDDLDLNFGEETHEEKAEEKHDELDLEHLEEEHVEEVHEEKHDDLDLDHLDEEHTEETHEEKAKEEHDELDLEDHEEHETEDNDLDLEHLDEEENHEEEHPAKPAPTELAEDNDLDFGELEKHEEEKPATEVKKESHEDDLNFDDLESLSPKKLEPQIHKDLDDDLDLELEMADKKPEASKPQTPPVVAPKDITPKNTTDGIDLFDLEIQEKPMPQTAPKTSSNDEIDLEFEKEIMGLKPASLPEKSVEDFMSNPAQPMQQNYASQSQVSVMNPPIGSNNKSNGIYDSTLRQVGDSVRKLVDAKNVVSGISTFSQGPAFVELATHLMEPKLEKWLNEHLPDLVEQIVREEIKKIIPKD
ncbi:MAG: DUF2497 domain-containing protein [Pseudomonadota bacterium]